MRQLELLAPAKDFETGKAAIDAGADAVYIGPPRFGARAAAGNSIDSIKALIRYAHLFGAKVHLALNTILKDTELQDARNTIVELYEAGIDAVIIQDMGLLKMDLPPVPIHASTQTNNQTVEKVAFFEAIGMDRVILARELSIDEIKKIREKTSVELEFFVHGALCVSYSGQCYLSQALVGRSANRGQCSQPCRSAYSLYDSNDKILYKDKQLLSLKDLNLSNRLSDLVDAGITSFKIEGRLKDITYVKNVVAHYRKELDKIIAADDSLSKASSGVSRCVFSPDPERSFNRGNMEHFTNGRTENMSSFHTQKSIGKYIGTAVSADAKNVVIDTPVKINNNDGLCYFDMHNRLKGFKVKSAVKGKVYVGSEIRIDPGTKVYRNFDHQFIKDVQREDSCIRKINVNMTFGETTNGFFLEAIDEDNNSVIVSVEAPKELARNKEAAEVNINKQLTKTGNTDFEVVNMKIDTAESYFIPAGKLNQLRRDVLQQLSDERTANYKSKKCVINSNDITPYPEKILDFTSNIMNEKAREFYEQHGAEVDEYAFEKMTDYQGETVMTTKYCILHELGACLLDKDSKKFDMPLYLENNGKRLKLDFDCKKCQMKVIF